MKDGAPTALDTLNELAAAIGDNENYANHNNERIDCETRFYNINEPVKCKFDRRKWISK